MFILIMGIIDLEYGFYIQIKDLEPCLSFEWYQNGLIQVSIEEGMMEIIIVLNLWCYKVHRNSQWLADYE